MKKRVLALLGFICIQTVAAANSVALPLTSDGRLELPAAVRWLLGKNFSLRLQALEADSARDEVKRAWGEFDPSFFASSTYEDNVRRLNAIDFSSYGLGSSNPEDALFKEVNLRSALGIQGKLSGTGTQYEISTTLDRLSNTVNQSGRFFSPEMQSYAGISLTQPLIKDVWYGGTNASWEAARVGVRIADRSREVEVVNKTIELVNAYYDMAFGLENVKVKDEAVAVASRLLEENKKRLSVGKMMPLDVTEADVKVSEAKEEYILAQDFLRDRRTKLLKLLVDQFEPGRIPEFTVSAVLAINAPTESAGDLASRALGSRPDYLMALEQRRKDEVGYNAARSARLPQLDLKFTYGYGGLDSTIYRTYRQVLYDNDGRWSIGAVLTIPIGGTKGKAEQRIARHKLEEDDLNIAELRATINLDVSNSLERIAALQRRLDTAATSRELATQGLDVEQNRLEAGQSTSFSVLDFQRKVSEARTRELAARVDLKKAEAELWASMGALMPNLGIVINADDEPARSSFNFKR
jgi:outer membrane protein TolC